MLCRYNLPEILIHAENPHKLKAEGRDDLFVVGLAWFNRNINQAILSH